MIVGGLWWLEQWHEAHKPFYKYADDSGPTGAAASVIYATMTGVAPAIAIGASPYGHMQLATMRMEDYVARRGYQGRHWNFDIVQKRFTFSRTFSHRLMLRTGAKIGARVIPYAGWALLMLDAWHVGKWIGEKTNPFD
jgi:hypothetical protein